MAAPTRSSLLSSTSRLNRFGLPLVSAALLLLSGCDRSDSSAKSLESDASPQDLAQRNAGASTWVYAGDLRIDFIYTHEEMFAFDIEAYLREHAPHLTSHAEAISHFAGFRGVSPRLLLALAERETGVVSGGHDVNRPFAALVDGNGWVAQLDKLSERLEANYYATGKRAADWSAQRALSSVVGEEQKLDELARAYRKLFPNAKSYTKKNDLTDANARESFIDLGMQFPFEVGVKWSNGGAHTNSGSGDSPLSSLDFFGGGDWGDDLSDMIVVAVAAGTIKKHSSCMIEVVHDEGWSTTYYHMDALVPESGESVDINDPLGIYAADKDQALCNGGHSTGPHVHWTLKKDGQQTHLLDYELSYYRIHPGQTSYDSDCSRFWLQRGDDPKVCAYRPILNEGLENDDDTTESTGDESTSDETTDETTTPTDDTTSTESDEDDTTTTESPEETDESSTSDDESESETSEDSDEGDDEESDDNDTESSDDTNEDDESESDDADDPDSGDDDPKDDGDDAGCSCRASASSSGAGYLSALFILGILRRRRRSTRVA